MLDPGPSTMKTLTLALLLICSTLAIECQARSGDFLDGASHLTLAQPSSYDCAKAGQDHCPMPNVDTLELTKLKDNIYWVDMQKVYASVTAGVTSPSYCQFDGLGEYSAGSLVIFKNQKQDGRIVTGLRIDATGDTLAVVDTEPAGNRGYCGKRDSFNGLTFKLR